MILYNGFHDFIYIKDIVSANIHALEAYHSLRGKYFEVSTGIANSFEDMLEIFGIRYEYFTGGIIPKGYQFFTCGDPKKWMKNWNPKFSLLQGVIDYKAYLEKSASL